MATFCTSVSTGRQASQLRSTVSIHPHGPEVRVFGAVQLVEGQAVRGRVQLKVESGSLGRPLLLRRQAAKAVGERVGDSEIHSTT